MILFDESMRAEVAERVELEHDLLPRLEFGQLHVVYQPVVRLPGHEAESAEALVRWTHPTLGAIPPVRFIPVAEETNLIGHIGNFVLREGLRQLAQWRTRPGMEGFSLAVNLSGVQLHDANLVERIRGAFEEFGVPGEALCLELTESVLMEDSALTISILGSLRTLGVRIAIDDFGTEYSSLAYLRRFPVDTLKIDQSFVRSMQSDDTADETLIVAIVAMAHALGILTVAEGVETEEQADRVSSLGCDEAQGYLFSARCPPTSCPASCAGCRRARPPRPPLTVAPGRSGPRLGARLSQQLGVQSLGPQRRRRRVERPHRRRHTGAQKDDLVQRRVEPPHLALVAAQVAEHRQAGL